MGFRNEGYENRNEIEKRGVTKITRIEVRYKDVINQKYMLNIIMTNNMPHFMLASRSCF